MPVEKSGESVPVDIVVRNVDILLSVVELWTLGVVTCNVNMVVFEIEAVVEDVFEDVAVDVKFVPLVEEIRLVDVVFAGVVV